MVIFVVVTIIIVFVLYLSVPQSVLLASLGAFFSYVWLLLSSILQLQRISIHIDSRPTQCYCNAYCILTIVFKTK